MNPVLVELLRAAHCESMHRGALAVLDADGGVVATLGDIDRPVFPRSAVKLLQALPLVESDAADRLRLNDSGLDLRQYLKGYVAPDHPVMREVSAALQAATGCDLARAPQGIDGCSIPTFAIPLRHLALAYARAGTGIGLRPGHALAAKRLREAVARSPFMVAGTDRFDTRVMERFRDRVCCKVGAEGVYCAALPERGLGVAIKIDDGNNARAAEVAMAAVIEAFVALDDADASFIGALSDLTLKNWNGIEVGTLRATDTSRRALMA